MTKYFSNIKEEFKTIWNFKNSDHSINPEQDQDPNCSNVCFLQINCQLSVPTLIPQNTWHLPSTFPNIINSTTTKKVKC